MNKKPDVRHSNLPLLFCNGSPTSLESMNMLQLQNFLIFLLKCVHGQEVSSLSLIERPNWWPEEVAFSDEILQKSSKKGLWSSMLRKVILQCYQYHDCKYLLDFSGQLMQRKAQSVDSIVIIDNGNGTRSLKNITSNNLLVTFKAENQDYDQRVRQRENSFSTLSPMKGGFNLSSENNSSDPRLPKCADLYLCDICGKDFDKLANVLAHERVCSGQSGSPTTTLLQQSVTPNKENFFSYFNLRQNGNDETIPSGLASAQIVRPKPVSYAKFASIDVSSPLGNYIVTLTGTGCEMNKRDSDAKMASVAERRTTAARGVRRSRFPVTFRGYRDRLANKQSSHAICFTMMDRELRMQTLRTGLSPKSLKLRTELSKRRCFVELRQLDIKNPPEIEPEELKKILEEYHAFQLQRSSPPSTTPASPTVSLITSPSKALAIEMIDISNGHDTFAFHNGQVPTMVDDGTYVSTNFYRNIMYSKIASSRQREGEDIECIDISSTEDEAEEEIDDPEEDFDDEVTVFELDEDENLSMDIEMSVL